MAVVTWWVRTLLVIFLSTSVFGAKEINETFGASEKNITEKDVDIDTNSVVNENEILETKHILMYHPWSTRSNMMQQKALLRGILSKGYHVTGVFPHATNIEDVRY